MIQIDVLDDGSEVLVSDERFKTLSLTVDGEEQPTRFAVVLTDEMKDAIIQVGTANPEINGRSEAEFRFD